MKRFFKAVLKFIATLVVLILIFGFLGYLWSKSHKKPTTFGTEQAVMGDIVKKTVATGAINPRNQVEIKPRVSGVLERITVQAGDPIARIRIVPNAQGLAQAQSGVTSAQISYDNAKRELDRNQKLFGQGVIADADLAKFRTDFALQKETLAAAQTNLQIVKDGQSRSGEKNSNVIVTSTVDGMVIDVPVKVGYSVTESNTFNAGTTIATVADMNDMIFQGQVDESEVGKVKVGMALKIKIGALESEQFDGKLEYISPQGKLVDGAIQFEIKAAITKKPGIFIRAGYSANADVVLDERKQVLSIREALVQFDEAKDKNKQPFVEVESSPQMFTRHDVKLGLSDGITTEVLSGVSKDDHIKIPSNAGPAMLPPGGPPPPPPRK